jgi:hypothetical protein
LATEGFSANIPTLSVSSSTQLTNWGTSAPYFGGANFNPTTGNYTVPTTGRYSIKATINYATAGAITLSIGAGVDPVFNVRRTSPTTTNLINGLLPILNVNVTLLTLRSILGSAAVTLAGDVTLNAGDVIGLFYDADGLTLTLNLGGGASSGIVWSIHQIT